MPDTLRELIRVWRAAHKQRGFSMKIRDVPGKGIQVNVKTREMKPRAAATVAELMIFEAIGANPYTGDGVSSLAVNGAIKEAMAAGATKLRILVNSPGGDCFEGIAISNAIKRFNGEKVVCVEGLCASAASYIAMAGDEIITAPDAMWMIHNPWGFAMGDADAMREIAANLDKIGGVMAESYAARTELPIEKVQKMMAAETWMTADEAKKYGFTDSVAEPGPDECDEEGAEYKQGKVPAGIDKLDENHQGPSSAVADDTVTRDLIKSMKERALKVSARASPGRSATL